MKREDMQKEIQKLQHRLQESRNQFKNIIERSMDGILIVDKEGAIRYSNPAACQILGRRQEDIYGQPFGFPLLSSKCTEIDIPYQGREKKTAEMRVVDTFWENREAYLLSLRDITQRKKEERLRRESLERAKKIQKSLFPKTFPHFPEMELEGRYRHAENIGGDFFDIRRVKDELLLLMADVTGHGLDAALITIFLSTFLRRELEYGEESTWPLYLLKRLQQDFFHQGFPDDYSLEVFLAFIHLDTMEMRYAAAGNIRAVLLDEKNRLQPLPESHGALINNTITDPLFGSNTINISPQQTLLIYTDGVDEPFLITDPSLGQKLLKKTLFNTRGLLSTEEMLERILGDFMLHINKDPKDDMAILALQPKKEITGRRRWSCPPQTSHLRPMVDTILKEIQHLPLDHDLVKMALLEAVSNAIVHTPKGNNVTIESTWNRNELNISVKDNGPGFNWRKTLKNRIDLLEAQERGRGLSIIELSTQRFTLNNQGNKIVMSWSFSQSSFDQRLSG